MHGLITDPSNLHYVLAIATSLVTGIAFAVRYLIKVFSFLRAKYDYICGIHTKVEKIFDEITPNHGSSMKDHTSAMAARIGVVEMDLKKNNDMTEKIFYRQRWTLDNINTAVFESDAAGRYVWVNSQYLGLVKRDSALIFGVGWKNVVHSEDRDRVVENWESCVKDSRDFEDSFRVVDSDGKEIKVLCSAHKTEGNGYIGSLKVLTLS